MIGARFRRWLWLLGALVALVVAPSRSARAEAGRAGRHILRLEGAGALMVGQQSDRFDFGGGVGASYEFRFIDYLGVEARYSAFFFPEPGADPHYGAYHGVGAALRVHPIPKVELGDLWISAGPNAVFTGSISRFGLEAGAGFEFAIAERARLGPFVRYVHVFQPSGNALGPEDGGFLEFGLSFAFVPSRREEEEEETTPPAPVEEPPAQEEPEPQVAQEEPPAQEEPEPEVAQEEPEPEAGPGGELLPERVLFPHGDVRPSEATLAEIDAVAQEIQAHPEWERIVIEGHASDVGDRTYNMRLSERRAEQVRAALIRRGVDPNRLEVEAYGHTRPEVPGHTPEAYARNRRVAFRVFTR
jgi:outer membrane protein OmpA-like peptidoglycan-associated protein